MLNYIQLFWDFEHASMIHQVSPPIKALYLAPYKLPYNPKTVSYWTKVVIWMLLTGVYVCVGNQSVVLPGSTCTCWEGQDGSISQWSSQSFPSHSSETVHHYCWLWWSFCQQMGRQVWTDHPLYWKALKAWFTAEDERMRSVPQNLWTEIYRKTEQDSKCIINLTVGQTHIASFRSHYVGL